jgi:hypothetical protein
MTSAWHRAKMLAFGRSVRRGDGADLANHDAEEYQERRSQRRPAPSTPRRMLTQRGLRMAVDVDHSPVVIVGCPLGGLPVVLAAARPNGSFRAAARPMNPRATCA